MAQDRIGYGFDDGYRRQHARFDGIGSDVADYGVDLGGDDVGGDSWTAVTPIVFWAVMAVRADVPNTPSAEKVFRSAWMPAPPPESEPAIVIAVGGLVEA